MIVTFVYILVPDGAIYLHSSFDCVQWVT